MTERISAVALNIEENIEEICRSIFRAYAGELAKQPASYIICSIWGVNAEGELTDNQKAIHEMLQPVVEQIFKSLALEDLDPGRETGIDYLIRCFVISKMLLMVTLFKAAARKAGRPNVITCITLK